MQTQQKENTSEVFTPQKVEPTFFEVLESLSEKEKQVIKRRIGVNGAKETLQSIGNSFSPAITRERVRQIEDAGIKKIGRIVKATELATIQEKAQELIALHEGILVKDKLVNQIIKDLELPAEINHSLIEIIIQSDFEISKSKPKLGVKTHFFLPSFNKKIFDPVHKEALKILKRKKDVMEKDSLYEMINDALKDKFKLNNVLIDATLDVFEDIIK